MTCGSEAITRPLTCEQTLLLSGRLSSSTVATYLSVSVRRKIPLDRRLHDSTRGIDRVLSRFAT